MSYRDMDVYRKSFRLALEMHHFSLLLPQYLRYDLSDQLRRASRSVPSNIAEGYARNRSLKDVIGFLQISLGSNDEVLFNLEFLKEVKLISPENYEHFVKEYTYLGKQLYTLMKSLAARRKTPPPFMSNI